MKSPSPPCRRSGRRSILATFAGALLTLVVAAPAVAVPGADSNPNHFVALDEAIPQRALFVVEPTRSPFFQELWSTDGTTAGTFRVDDCDRCRGHSPLGGKRGVFWAALVGTFDAPEQTFAWSDGSPGGHHLMQRPNPERQILGEHYSATLDRVFYLEKRSDDDRIEVWTWDGTDAGPAHLPAPLAGGHRGVVAFADAGDHTYIQTVDPELRFHVWVTDGTGAGTRDLGVVPGAVLDPRHEEEIVSAGERVVLLLAGDDCQLRVWAASADSGIQPVTTLEGEICALPPADMTTVGDRLYFKARSEEHGQELWTTDGTAAGTRRLTDFDPFYPLSEPASFVSFRGAVYFSVGFGIGTEEVWRTDGTPAGTAPLGDFCGEGCWYVYGPWVAEDVLAWVQSGTGDEELWVSDGTVAGTRLLTTLSSDRTWSIRRAGGTWFFYSPGPLRPEDSLLYSLAPGAGSPSLIARFPWVPGSPRFHALALGSRLLFGIDDGLHGEEPWVSDGTAAGTRLLRDIAADGSGEVPPAAPTLHGLEPSENQVSLFWDLADETPAEGRIEVQMRGPGQGWHEVAEVPRGTGGPAITGLSADTPYTFRIREVNAAGASPWSDEASVRTRGGGLSGDACTPADDHLCFQGARFSVKVTWWNQHQEGPVADFAAARRVPGIGDGRSAFLWFFQQNNVELVVKMLDGSIINGHAWLFYGALTDVEYWVTVHDHVTDKTRTYRNPPGEICGLADTEVFYVGRSAAGAAGGLRAVELPVRSRVAASHPTTPCVENATTLCLQGGRYAVTVDWADQHHGETGVGGAVPYSDRTGFFWFFQEDNIELVVKVLDGTLINGKTWIFYGALTDVGYTLTVTDTATGHAVERYVNEPGNVCGGSDTEAF